MGAMTRAIRRMCINDLPPRLDCFENPSPRCRRAAGRAIALPAASAEFFRVLWLIFPFLPVIVPFIPFLLAPILGELKGAITQIRSKVRERRIVLVGPEFLADDVRLVKKYPEVFRNAV